MMYLFNAKIEELSKLCEEKPEEIASLVDFYCEDSIEDVIECIKEDKEPVGMMGKYIMRNITLKHDL